MHSLASPPVHLPWGEGKDLCWGSLGEGCLRPAKYANEGAAAVWHCSASPCCPIDHGIAFVSFWPPAPPPPGGPVPWLFLVPPPPPNQVHDSVQASEPPKWLFLVGPMFRHHPHRPNMPAPCELRGQLLLSQGRGGSCWWPWHPRLIASLVFDIFAASGRIDP